MGCRVIVSETHFSTLFYHSRQWQNIVRNIGTCVRFNGVTYLRMVLCSVTRDSRGKWSSSAHLTVCRPVIITISVTVTVTVLRT
jgi:hypothetical protein